MQARPVLEGALEDLKAGKTAQAVRALMQQAAITADIDPDRLSFTTALRVLRRFVTSAATAAKRS